MLLLSVLLPATLASSLAPSLLLVSPLLPLSSSLADCTHACTGYSSLEGDSRLPMLRERTWTSDARRSISLAHSRTLLSLARESVGEAVRSTAALHSGARSQRNALFSIPRLLVPRSPSPLLVLPLSLSRVFVCNTRVGREARDTEITSGTGA